MTIHLRCPCGTILAAGEESAGQRVQCPNCHTVLAVPANVKPVAASSRPAPRPAPQAAPQRPPPQRPAAQPNYSQPNYSQGPLYPRPTPAKPRSLVPLLIVGGVLASMVLMGVGSWFAWSKYKPLLARATTSAEATPTEKKIDPALTIDTSEIGPKLPNPDPSASVTPPVVPLAAATSEATIKAAIPTTTLSASDPLYPTVEKFLSAAMRASSTDAIKLLNQDGFRKHVRSENGSYTAQLKELEIPRMVNNLARQALEGMVANGGLRHWSVVGKTKVDGLPTVILRYYREPYPPHRWLQNDELIDQMSVQLSFDEYVAAAGVLHFPREPINGQLGEWLSQRPDMNGLLVPRTGYVGLMFDDVDGKPQLTDLYNPIGKLRFSRCAGELYMRDWEVIQFQRERPQVLAKQAWFSILGEFTKDSGTDEGIMLNGVAYFTRYEDPNAEIPTSIPPMQAADRNVRAFRLAYLISLLDLNIANVLNRELSEFRKDFANDPGADMAMVSFALMRDKPRINPATANVVIAAADRLHQEYPDPFLRYAQWYVAQRSDDEKLANDRASLVRQNGGFYTSYWHQVAVQKAVNEASKELMLTALRDTAKYWNPDAPAPTVKELEVLSWKWIAANNKRTGVGDLSRAARGPQGAPWANGDRPRPTNGNPPPGMPVGPTEAQGPPPDFGNRQSSMGPPNGPPPGFPGPGPGAGPGPGPGAIPPMTGPQVTIELTCDHNIDLKFLQGFLQKLKVSGHRANYSGNSGAIVLSYGGDVNSVVQAIDFGEIQSVDAEKRIIRVKLP